MFAKIIVVIVAIGVVACILLAVRQQRVQAAHELTDVQRRVLDQDRTLWQLRTEIAGRIVPPTVAVGSKKFGPLAGNTPLRYRELVQRENDEAAYSAAPIER